MRRLGRSMRRAWIRRLMRTKRRCGRSSRRPISFLLGRVRAVSRPLRRKFGRTVKRIVRGLKFLMKRLRKSVRRSRRRIRRIGRTTRRLVRSHGRFARRHIRRFVGPGRLGERLRRPVRRIRRLMRRLKVPMRRYRRLMRMLRMPMRRHGRHTRRHRLIMRRFERPMWRTRRHGRYGRARVFWLLGLHRKAGRPSRFAMMAVRIFVRLMRTRLSRLVMLGRRRYRRTRIHCRRFRGIR